MNTNDEPNESEPPQPKEGEKEVIEELTLALAEAHQEKESFATGFAEWVKGRKFIAAYSHAGATVLMDGGALITAYKSTIEKEGSRGQ